jgi:hypothetical protein
MCGSLVGSKVSLTGPTATLAAVVSLSTRRLIVQYVPIIACVSSFFFDYSIVMWASQVFYYGAFQTCIVASEKPEAIKLPLGDHAMVRSSFECPA